jgi:hypothetical protein
MVADQLLECEICNEPFDSATHVPQTLPCGHSFCRVCVPQLKNCPFGCRHVINRDAVITNYTLLSLIEHLQANVGGGKQDDAVVQAVAESISAEPISNEEKDNSSGRRKSDVLHELESLKQQREEYKLQKEKFEALRKENEELKKRNQVMTEQHQAEVVQTGVLAAVGGALLAGAVFLAASLLGGGSKKKDED